MMIRRTLGQLSHQSSGDLDGASSGERSRGMVVVFRQDKVHVGQFSFVKGFLVRGVGSRSILSLRGQYHQDKY